MEKYKLDSEKLTVFPAQNSSMHDFDFLSGSWKIHSRKLASRLTGSTEWVEFEATGTMKKHLLGLGNYDSFHCDMDNKPFEGMSLRLFSLETKLWKIYWADSNRCILDIPVTGSFDNNCGNFYAVDYFEGRRVLLKFNWDKTDPNNPIWSQAYSEDDGETWEWNWYMFFSRN